jgi:menaquinone-9 beta-reductase
MIAPAHQRTVEIIGGGLAGLGLALGLRRVGVPVVLIEAGAYPRHRVCGEFITSLDEDTIKALGLPSLLHDALPADSVTWFHGADQRLSQRLPTTALCLSRHALDDRMAQRLVELGGELRTRQRTAPEPAEGRVVASGRRRMTGSRWVGLKAHFRDLTLTDDLELHLGRNGYVGLTRIEGEKVNVCGLFERTASPPQRVSKQSVLGDQLRLSGLSALADRLERATLDPDSTCSVAGLDYGAAEPSETRLQLGDQFGLIPPFTGNGMTVALQSARIALEPLRRWSAGDASWTTTVREIHAEMRRELAPRIRRARTLHPWMLQPRRQRWLVLAARTRLLPTRLLYHLLH